MIHLHKHKLGEVTVSQEAVEVAAGISTLECYGIVGMVSQNKVKDGVFELLRRENASKGIVVSFNEDGVTVVINVIVLYGTKISEVCRNIQEKVAFDLNNMLGIQIHAVNVIVQGVQVGKNDK